MESWTSPRNRLGSNIWRIERSIAFFTSAGVKVLSAHGLPHGSFHLSQDFGGVSVVPYLMPSDSLPETSSCVVAKKPGISPSCWLRQFWRTPSSMETVAFLSSITAKRMPFT